MDAVAKMCEECIVFVSGECEGKEQAQVKAGKKPCNKYQFATDELISNLDAEPDIKDDEQLEAVVNTVDLTIAEPTISANLVGELADVLEPVCEPARQVFPTAQGKMLAKRAERIKGGAKSQEQRQADFQRILAKRLPKAVAAINSIGNLNNKYAYAPSETDIEDLHNSLIIAVANMVDKFRV